MHSSEGYLPIPAMLLGQNCARTFLSPRICLACVRRVPPLFHNLGQSFEVYRSVA